MDYIQLYSVLLEPITSIKFVQYKDYEMTLLPNTLHNSRSTNP